MKKINHIKLHEENNYTCKDFGINELKINGGDIIMLKVIKPVHWVNRSENCYTVDNEVYIPVKAITWVRKKHIFGISRIYCVEDNIYSTNYDSSCFKILNEEEIKLFLQSKKLYSDDKSKESSKISSKLENRGTGSKKGCLRSKSFNKTSQGRPLQGRNITRRSRRFINKGGIKEGIRIFN